MNSDFGFVAASPPDVRRGYASPSRVNEGLGAAPLVRPLAHKYSGAKPEPETVNEVNFHVP